jgi:hypothetical protein
MHWIRSPTASTRIAGPATIVWESLFVLAVPAGPIPTLVALAVAAGRSSRMAKSSSPPVGA